MSGYTSITKNLLFSLRSSYFTHVDLANLKLIIADWTWAGFFLGKDYLHYTLNFFVLILKILHNSIDFLVYFHNFLRITELWDFKFRKNWPNYALKYNRISIGFLLVYFNEYLINIKSEIRSFYVHHDLANFKLVIADWTWAGFNSIDLKVRSSEISIC